jgi:peptide/nickel transport system permease protein
MLESLAADFTRTARAKGATESTVVYRHVFRNSLLPLITSSAGLIPGLLGGAIVVERIFSIQGMGSLFIEAINARDRDLILDQTLIVGGIGLLCYLLADILYVVADPRVSYE